jgi:hypothetical protein
MNFFPVLPGSARQAGENIHKNAQSIDYGQMFADALHSSISRAAQVVAPATDIVRAAAPTFSDFVAGLAQGPRRDSVTVALPPATPAKAKAATKAPTPSGLGKLTPAAAAVLANAAAPAKGEAGADPLAALGKLSFRQLVTLGDVVDKTSPRGSTKAPSATDQAGAALASIYQQQFKASIDAAGSDPAKQQAALDAFEKKMLPIALKGNTADEYLYGSQ